MLPLFASARVRFSSQMSVVSSVRAFYNRIRKLEYDRFTVL